MPAWMIPAAFSLAAGINSAKQYRKASKSAVSEAKAQAAEIRRQKFDVELLTAQQHQNRMEQFSELVSQNEAQTAYMGRTGRSIQALRKREERLYGRDVSRMRVQEAREKRRLEAEARATTSRGLSSSEAYRSQARTSLLQSVGNIGGIS